MTSRCNFTLASRISLRARRLSYYGRRFPLNSPITLWSEFLGIILIAHFLRKFAKIWTKNPKKMVVGVFKTSRKLKFVTYNEIKIRTKENEMYKKKEPILNSVRYPNKSNRQIDVTKKKNPNRFSFSFYRYIENNIYGCILRRWVRGKGWWGFAAPSLFLLFSPKWKNTFWWSRGPKKKKRIINFSLFFHYVSFAFLIGLHTFTLFNESRFRGQGVKNFCKWYKGSRQD